MLFYWYWYILPDGHTGDAIITSLLRQNDVAKSFWRNNNVVIASCVRYVWLTQSTYTRTLLNTTKHNKALTVWIFFRRIYVLVCLRCFYCILISISNQDFTCFFIDILSGHSWYWPYDSPYGFHIWISTTIIQISWRHFRLFRGVTRGGMGESVSNNVFWTNKWNCCQTRLQFAQDNFISFIIFLFCIHSGKFIISSDNYGFCNRIQWNGNATW